MLFANGIIGIWRPLVLVIEGVPINIPGTTDLIKTERME